MPSTKKAKDFLYERESYLIRGACFDVWREFRGAFKESVIDRALSVALKSHGLSVESQKQIQIYFHGEKIGSYVPDKIINNIIIVELKAKPNLTKQDIDQFWKYLKGSQYQLGFLVNFSPERLTIKRIVYNTARKFSVPSA